MQEKETPSFLQRQFFLYFFKTHFLDPEHHHSNATVRF